MTLAGSSLTPEELRQVGSFVWRGRKGEQLPLVLEGVRTMPSHLLCAFAGYHNRSGASTLTLGELLAEASRLPDPGPDVAYTFQLIGLAVQTDDGRALGTLTDVIPTGAHPVYVVRGERELLIPANPEVLRGVDLGAGVITVALPKGLEDL